MSKAILRKTLINLRRINYLEEGIDFSPLKKILNKLNLKKNKIIGGYYPINSEIECLSILNKLEKKNFKISLPKTKKNSKMDFYEWSSNDILKISKQGIPEPYKKNKVIPDVLIVPLVGFDRKKFRLGYGGGYYDRYIGKIQKFKKILTIGFAFSFQEIETFPINKFDQKLDFILTNKGIIK